jgi:hypothetical protein
MQKNHFGDLFMKNKLILNSLILASLFSFTFATRTAQAFDLNWEEGDVTFVGTISWRQIDGGTAEIKPLTGFDAGGIFKTTAKFSYNMPGGIPASPTNQGNGKIDGTYKRSYKYIGVGNPPSSGPNVSWSGGTPSLSASGPMPSGAGVTIESFVASRSFPVTLPIPPIPLMAGNIAMTKDAPNNLTDFNFSAKLTVKVTSGAGAPSGQATGASSNASVTIRFYNL